MCKNEWVKGICRKPAQKCSACDNREFIPVSDEVIRKHLLGYDSDYNRGKNNAIGVYPLLPDSTCWFLAADFDKENWKTDTNYFLKTCEKFNVPAYLEISRSGNGGHVWIFFKEPISADIARRMGCYLLTETMESYPEIGFDSYDRLFPNQDTVPKSGAGFGNLIALPFQGKAVQQGNTLFVDNYGQMIVDECHHIAAVSFEMIAKRCKARYFLGLSATVSRKDGQHPIIFMQLGPLRYKVSDKEQARKRPFDHTVLFRRTDFSIKDEDGDSLPIQQIYKELCQNDIRNQMIVKDITESLNRGRSPLVLTERKEHVDVLAAMPAKKTDNILQGGMGKNKVSAVLKTLRERKQGDRTVLVATGRFIGEGFDDDQLDTLFLAHPVSWRGTLAQYAGRLHRLHDEKKEVIIYDYADLDIPVLHRMCERRKNGYKAIGYSIIEDIKQNRMEIV